MIPRYFLWIGEIFINIPWMIWNTGWNWPFQPMLYFVHQYQAYPAPMSYFSSDKSWETPFTTWIQMNLIPTEKPQNRTPPPQKHEFSTKIIHPKNALKLEIKLGDIFDIRSRFQLKLHNIIIRYRNPSNVDGHSLRGVMGKCCMVEIWDMFVVYASFMCPNNRKCWVG